MPPERSKSKRKLVPSKRASENAGSSRVARPPTSRTKKTQPRVPVHIDLTSTDLSSVGSTRTASRKAPKPCEPLPTKYGLSIEIFVGGVAIYSRTMLQTAGAFDYAGFMSVEAQKTSEHCARIGGVSSIRTSKATITYNKKDACHSHIENPEDWRLFDEMAGAYLGDKSKKDLHINWNIFYQLKAVSTEPEKEAVEPYEDDDEAETEDDENNTGEADPPAKKTATNRRLAEARASPHAAVTSELLQIYKCQAPGCRNSSSYCFPVGGVNDGHYPLSANAIRQWMFAVQDGTATVYSPPASLVNSIVNVMKAQKAQKAVPSPPTPTLPPPPSYSLPPALPYYSPYPLPPPAPYGHAGPHGSPPESSNQANASKSTKQTSRPSSSDSMLGLRSSPTDPLDLTRQYIAWYRERFPAQGHLLDIAAERLEDAAYGIHAIKKLRAEDWCRIGVPEGLGDLLSRNVMKFRQQRGSD